MTDTSVNVNVQTTSAGDKPPKDSLAQATTWWLTRPWVNTVAVLVPISLIVSSTMLFRYQVLIGRPELLSQALASPAALIAVLTAGLVLLLLPVVMIFGSTWFADAATALYRVPEAKVPEEMPRLLFAGSIVWLLTVIVSSMTGSHTFMSVAAFVLLVAFTVGGARIEVNAWRVASNNKNAANKSSAARGAGVGLTFWGAVMASSMAPLALLVLRPVLPTGASGNAAALVLLFSLMFISLGAGWRLFFDFAQGKPLAEVRKRVLLGGLALVGCLALSSFRTLDLQTLHALGVYSTKSSHFAIVTPGLLSEFNAAGIKLTRQADNRQGEAIASGYGDLYVATAFVRYRFGNQLVLCTEKYDPLQSAPASSSGCLDVRTDEVRHIMPAATDAHATGAIQAKPEPASVSHRTASLSCNVLARLHQTPRVDSVEITLRLMEELVADPHRYDWLHGEKVDHVHT